MSFRYVMHLKTGQNIRSGVLNDAKYDSVRQSLIEFMGFVAGARAFEPEQEDTDVLEVLVDRSNISHISFLEVK